MGQTSKGFPLDINDLLQVSMTFPEKQLKLTTENFFLKLYLVSTLVTDNKMEMNNKYCLFTFSFIIHLQQ